jgi:hypothetical protein
MEVVGIDRIKLFHNFIFQKSVVILPAISIFAGYFFSDFDMSKKSKITKSALGALFLWVGHPASSRLLVSEVNFFFPRSKHGASNSRPTRVYALSCLCL